MVGRDVAPASDAKGYGAQFAPDCTTTALPATTVALGVAFSAAYDFEIATRVNVVWGWFQIIQVAIGAQRDVAASACCVPRGVRSDTQGICLHTVAKGW